MTSQLQFVTLPPSSSIWLMFTVYAGGYYTPIPIVGKDLLSLSLVHSGKLLSTFYRYLMYCFWDSLGFRLQKPRMREWLESLHNYWIHVKLILVW